MRFKDLKIGDEFHFVIDGEDGEPDFWFIKKSGRHYTIPDQPGIAMTSGNAGVIVPAAADANGVSELISMPTLLSAMESMTVGELLKVRQSTLRLLGGVGVSALVRELEAADDTVEVMEIRVKELRSRRDKIAGSLEKELSRGRKEPT